MGSKKTQVQTNTPGWSVAPETADIGALRGMVNERDYAVPLRNQFARAEKKLDESYQNPLGSYTTADVRDKAVREQKLDMQQNLGMELANAAQQNADSRFNRQATVAGMTSPTFYNASSKTTNPFTLWDGISMGLGGASGILQ